MSAKGQKKPVRGSLADKGIMPVKVGRSGTGLTTHDLAFYNLSQFGDAAVAGVDIAEEVAALRREASPSPLERAEDLKQWARSVLDAHRLPSRNRFVVEYPDGRWRYRRRYEAILPGMKIVSGLFFADRHADTRPWFAAAVLRLVAQLRRAIIDNKATQAAAIGWELGALQERYWWKFLHEKAAQQGHQLIEGRQKGSVRGAAVMKSQGKAREAVIVGAARKLWAKDPLLARNNLDTARRIEGMQLKELRLSDKSYLGSEAIRRHIAAALKAGALKKP